MGKVTSRVEPLELILEKSFGVSPETLFDALTQSEHLGRLWAPGDLYGTDADGCIGRSISPVPSLLSIFLQMPIM